VGNATKLDRPDRTIVALAGVAPDLDGLGAIPELLTRNTAHPMDWFSRYHHMLGHNAGFALVVTGASFLVATRRWKVAALAGLTFHLHLLCDVLGARGPDGDQWPIPYLLPFSRAWDWTWRGQWPLNGWQNFAITGAALALMFYTAWVRGYSPLEMISQKADGAFVAALRQRFGQPAVATLQFSRRSDDA